MLTTVTHQDDNNVPIGLFYGVLAALIWGAWPVFSRLGVQQSLNPFDIAALRFTVAGLIFLPYVLKKGLGGMSWKVLALLTLGAGAPYSVISVSGMVFAPASHASLVISSGTMIGSTVGGALLLGDRPTKQRILGMVVMLLGIGFIAFKAFSFGAPGEWMGELLFVLAGCLWASYTVAARAYRVDAFHATGLISVVSLVLYLPCYMIFGQPNLHLAPVSELVTQALAQGVFAAILALICYTKAVSILGAGRGGIFACMAPGVAVLLAYPVLGEQPGPTEAVGFALVALGMIVALELVKFTRR